MKGALTVEDIAQVRGKAVRPSSPETPGLYLAEPLGESGVGNGGKNCSTRAGNENLEGGGQRVQRWPKR